MPSSLRGLLAALIGRPYELEPDGDRWLPHHGLWGLLLAGVGWYLWAPGLSPELGSVLFIVGLLVALDDGIDHAVGGHIRRFTERVVGRPFGIRVGTPADFAYRVLVLALRRLG